ncbi:iron chaperone [Nonomuraea sp. NPDC048826]|uniref:iron chaperone n=1 Tax=Nonomuraea sp. NPDC048826 TaxID=3364347 RepID=UPI003716DD0D
MVQSAAANVDAYLEEVPEARREALTRLRDLCRAELAGFTEVMAHGMPGYRREEGIEVAFASQRNHISIYITRTDVRDAHAAELAGHDMGKGCLRFRKPEQVDFELVRSLLRTTAAAPGPVC